MQTSLSTGNIKSDRPLRRAYKIKEAAEILGVKPLSVRRAIARGVLKPCRVFRHVLIPADEIERLLKA
jgi:excisionase family DNA binding protein